MKRLSLHGYGLNVSLCLFFFFTATLSYSQDASQNLNTYYQFPLSVGIEYQNYSPFAEYGSTYNIFELSGNVRWPIPPLPILQPMVKGGMIRFDSQDMEAPALWDHTHWFGGLGLVASHRFAKNFEIGGEIAVSFSQSYFKNLIPESGTVGEKNLIFEGGLHIALNPSYNFNIDIHPNIKYLNSLGPLKDFNGFIFGIGFAGSYRFGKDPDSPQAIIRSIQFSSIDLPPLFAAMQSYYVKNPVGTITITNTDKQSITDVDVSFFQNGFMDSPTPSATIPELKSGESKEIELLASFNQEVFSTEGITPLTGEVIVTYAAGGKPAEQRQSVSYDLHDKTAVTWDDDRKVAAFITPADSALRNYSSFIRQTCKEITIPQYNTNLQFAIQAFHALSEIGVLYQIDPTLPFTEVQDNPMVVDSISLPRDTLKRITGDCDDLTVLFCTLLETVGIESGYITVPGHIYAAFNTKEESRNYANVHADRRMTINLDGELWVPVEITMIGNTGFQESWRKGIEEWSVYDDSPDKRGFFITRKAQELYRPVGLRETDLGLQYGTEQNIIDGFNREMDRLIEGAVSEYVKSAENQGTKKDWNKLGITYARYMRYGKAVQSFDRAIEMDPGYLSARINLANIFFLQEDYSAARLGYQEAAEKLEETGRSTSSTMLKLLINTSRACYKLEAFDDAGQYYAKAEQIDPDATKEYSYLAQASLSSDTGRAAEGDDVGSDILFIEEEDAE